MLRKKKKQKKQVQCGIAHIKATFNNTTVSICDILGNTLCWASSGTAGFKGKRKSTSFAAQLTGKNAALKAMEMGMQQIEVVLRGRGNGRESAIRALKSSGLSIMSIEDKTSLPHNGCRPPKRRRL